MRKIRQLQSVKSLFWDYKIDDISDKLLCQRIIEFFPVILNDFNKKEISYEEFTETLKLLKKNINKVQVNSRNEHIINILKKLIKRRFGNGS